MVLRLECPGFCTNRNKAENLKRHKSCSHSCFPLAHGECSTRLNISNIAASKFIKLLMHADIPISILRILMKWFLSGSFLSCSCYRFISVIFVVKTIDVVTKQHCINLGADLDP